MTTVNRRTKETDVRVELTKGNGAAKVETTIEFLDHMLVTLAKYAGLDLVVVASGDLEHHISEDVAITLGTALREFAPATAARYGSATVPMDDALVSAHVDIGGRFFYQGPLPVSRYDHFLRSMSDNARMVLHVVVERGTDEHHIIEGAFKATGMALRNALVEGGSAVFSTKGTVEMDVS
jgi:imidazoleglycerol-phosphate dehydratase